MSNCPNETKSSGGGGGGDKLQHNMIFLEIYHNVKLSKSGDYTF